VQGGTWRKRTGLKRRLGRYRACRSSDWLGGEYGPRPSHSHGFAVVDGPCPQSVHGCRAYRNSKPWITAPLKMPCWSKRPSCGGASGPSTGGSWWKRPSGAGTPPAPCRTPAAHAGRGRPASPAGSASIERAAQSSYLHRHSSGGAAAGSTAARTTRLLNRGILQCRNASPRRVPCWVDDVPARCARARCRHRRSAPRAAAIRLPVPPGAARDRHSAPTTIEGSPRPRRQLEPQGLLGAGAGQHLAVEYLGGLHPMPTSRTHPLDGRTRRRSSYLPAEAQQLAIPVH